ncbi:MAG: hypothetical protein WCR44_07005 [Verrucomicrobiota bacterium]
MNAPETELSKLQQSVRESRIVISRQYAGLLSDLDLQKRFTESVRHHPLRWVGGAATAGLIATLFGGRGGHRSRLGPQETSPRAKQKTSETLVSASVNGVGALTTLSKVGWISGALEVGKILYPILKPLVVEFATNAAKAGLAKRGRP